MIITYFLFSRHLKKSSENVTTLVKQSISFGINFDIINMLFDFDNYLDKQHPACRFDYHYAIIINSDF